MTLTEEQRAALKRVVAYMDEMYAIASPYYGCTEDANILRAMIDSSEHIPDATKMVGFDLKGAREAVHTLENFAFVSGKITAGQIQDVLWGARLLAASAAEIERLRAEISEQKGMIWKTQQVKKEQAAQIKELEDALAEERAKVIMLIEKLQLVANDPDWQSKGLKHDFDWYLAESKKQIESGEPEDQRCRRLGEPNGWTDPEGKIGPDDSKKISHLRPYEVVAADLAGMLAKSWQITAERIDVLGFCLSGEFNRCGCAECDRAVAVLRAMLEEAL